MNPLPAASPVRVLLVALTLTGCVTVDNRAPTSGNHATNAFDSTNADVHVGLARSALDGGTLDSASASAREALRVDPGRRDAAKILASAELLSGRSREALAAARRAAALGEEDADAWLLLADCAAFAGEPAESEAALRRAVLLGSREATLASAGSALARGDEALARELLSTDDRKPALGLLASRLADSSHDPDTLALIDAALRAEPDDADLKLAGDRLRMTLGGEAPTPQEFSRGDRDGGVSLESDLVAAAALLRDGRPAEAASRYRRLSRELPDDPRLRIALAEALLQAGDSDGAAAAFDAALAIVPRDLDALLGRARVELARGDFKAALVPLDRAISIAPDHGDARGLVVAAAAGLGDLARANREALAVRRIDPGGPLDHACRALLASHAAQAAHEKNPPHPQASIVAPVPAPAAGGAVATDGDAPR